MDDERPAGEHPAGDGSADGRSADDRSVDDGPVGGGPHSAGRGPRPSGGGETRYGRFAGGPDPLAPPVDLAEALASMADDVMAGYGPDQALREYLRRGGENTRGLDDLAGDIQRKRRSLLERHGMGGTIDEVKRLLDEAVLSERGQLARDITMDETDRTFREMQMENLPESPAAAVSELRGYDWQSPQAREAFGQIEDLLGRDMLDARFQGMKQALENATDEDRERVRDMLRDLGDLLEKRERGEDTDDDFARFMDEHGDLLPEGADNLDQLVDMLARRSAAAQRMLASMTEEQRAELAALSEQAFGSPDLQEQLDRVDRGLQGLRPDLDWSGGEQFEGDDGLGLGEGAGVLEELAELDRLAHQLSQAYPGASLTDLDVDGLDRHLGRDAGVDARTLQEIEDRMRESGFMRRTADGDLRLSPAALRRLGKTLLRDAATRLSGRAGQRDARLAGVAGEQTGATRAWEFGDTEPWDVGRTVGNAIMRTAAEGGDPTQGVRIRVDDVEVRQTEARTRAAVALLVDVSFSMAMEGWWLPMKRTALALHHLVRTRFRGDALTLITFGKLARTTDLDGLVGLGAEYEPGTNLHHGLMLAGEFFRKHPTAQPVLLIVTDGEPTAYLTPRGEGAFSYPPDSITVQKTIAELDRVGRTGATVTFFRLGDDRGLERFVAAMARRVRGTVVAPDQDDLGSAVVGEFMRTRRQGGDQRAG